MNNSELELGFHKPIDDGNIVQYKINLSQS
jgi:hypothetical protein